MKATKKAKTVDVRWRETKSYYPIYVCPSCKTTFHGGFCRATTRFKCDCGQELIINSLN